MAQNKTFRVSLDMKAPTAQRNEWEVVEGDNGNIIKITLTDDGSPVDLQGCRVLAVFGLPTGHTVEQDTEDARVILSDYGITVTGTPDTDDTVTVTVSGGSCSASVSGTGVSAAAVDGDAFLEKFQEDGSYVFTYTSAWQYGDNSVTIGGTDHNEITIALKTGSFSPGKSSSGLMKCEIQVYSGLDYDTLVTSAQFTFRCRRAIINDETVPADNNYPILVELIREVHGFVRSSQSNWDQTNQDEPDYIWNKPATMTPASHTHGKINNDGTTSTTYAHEASDWLVVADYSDSGRIMRTDITFGSNTNKWLDNTGAWTTPTAAQVGALSTNFLPDPTATKVAILNSKSKVFASETSAYIRDVDTSRSLTASGADSDAGCFLKVNSDQEVELTIPADTFVTGTEIEVCRYNTGAVKFKAGTGVTLLSAGSKVNIADRYGCAVLKKLDTNTWLLAGDLG